MTKPIQYVCPFCSPEFGFIEEVVEEDGEILCYYCRSKVVKVIRRTEVSREDDNLLLGLVICGRCGQVFDTERTLVCPFCGYSNY